MLRRARLVGQLWRWHRRAGLLAALFLLLMSLSGIVLNHGDDLALEQRFVASAWLRAIYGDTDSGWAAFRASGHWVLGDQGGRIFLDVREVARCNGALQGVVELAGMLLLGCERSCCCSARRASSSIPSPPLRHCPAGSRRWRSRGAHRRPMARIRSCEHARRRRSCRSAKRGGQPAAGDA
ncbi:MAG: hypothetical protein IPF49_15370 [Gammaproteobacteria bacterium]|nr:hypothetical protein [Gammaproteobacteria bacterium]